MFATYDDAIRFLFSQTNYENAPPDYDEVHYDVGRMARLVELVGSPHRTLRAAHIAGTKGKGSVAHMIESCLRAAGYSTGLFISPHIEHIEERIAVDGCPITPDRLKWLVETVAPAFETLAGEGRSPTFFELITAMAFVEFHCRAVDAAAVEVGMGGRFDSTNVLSPWVSVITTISLDHVRQLGPTVARIAREKAGILKRAVPAVVGRLPADAFEVVAGRADEVGAPLVVFGRELDFKRTSAAACDLYLPGGDMADVKVGLLGVHQFHNAALAAAACRIMAARGLGKLTDDCIRAGLARVRAPGRLEKLSSKPLVIADGAHNVASARALADALTDNWPGRRVWFVTGSMRDHDAAGVLRTLAPLAEGVVTTPVQSPRSLSSSELAGLAKEARCGEVAEAPDAKTALEIARKCAGIDDIICITGSFYLVGEIRPVFHNDRP